MRILFVNRIRDMWVGGDYTQLDNTVEQLRKLGVEVDVMESRGYGWSHYAKKYDIIHTFNFNMGWNEWLKEPKYPDTKYVCSMIYQPNQINRTDYQQRYDNLDAALWLTDGEKNRAVKDGVVLDNSKDYVIPNGIEEYWFEGPVSLEFRQQSDPTYIPYVLTVGRQSEHKGQKYVGAACQSIGAPYMCIGGNLEIKNDFFDIKKDMNRESLKNFYKYCATYVLVSKDEVMPMTVMEAGAMAKNIILTTGCEWKLPNVEYVDYGDVKGIAEAIKKSVVKPPNLQLQSMLKKMTWQSTAEQILNVYHKILKEQK